MRPPRNADAPKLITGAWVTPVRLLLYIMQQQMMRPREAQRGAVALISLLALAVLVCSVNAAPQPGVRQVRPGSVKQLVEALEDQTVERIELLGDLRLTAAEWPASTIIELSPFRNVTVTSYPPTLPRERWPLVRLCAANQRTRL